MSLSLGIDTVTATSANFYYSSVTGSPATIEVQISPRPDFSFCVCPIFSTSTASPQAITGLNQSQTYYARARGVTAGGVRLEWSNLNVFRTPFSTAQDLTVPSVFLDPALICLPAPTTELSWLIPVAGYPVANLLDDSLSASQSAGTGTNNAGHYLFFNTVGEPIDTIALLMTNMSEATSVVIQSGNTYSDVANGVGSVVTRYSSVARASAQLPGRMGYHGLYRFAAVTQAWWKISVLGILPGTRLQVGHLVVGKSIVSKRIARDMGTAFEDLGVIERNALGTPDRQSGLRMRTVDFDIATLDETLYETLYSQVHARLGNTDPVLVVPNPRAGAFLHDRILYGTLQGGRVTNPVSKYHTRRFQINSII